MIPHNYDHNRLRAVSLFSWSFEQNVRDTQMTMRVTKGARRERQAAALVSCLLRLCRSTLALACTPLTESEEKERLLAVYDHNDQIFIRELRLYI